MHTIKKSLQVAILGFGTVGGAVAHFLTHEKSTLQEKSGVDIHLKYIIDRDPSTVTIKNSNIVISDTVDSALNDPDVALLVELIGGVDAAREICTQAIKRGKHIVTANKALIAEHGTELLALARTYGVSVAFEASCGGGIPILRALYSGLISNRIDALYAIINGTCNFILSGMADANSTYDDALQQAQQLGYAEADPTLDVSGIDAAHKLAIMTSFAFGLRVNYRDIHTAGITEIDSDDVNYGKYLGLQIKLIAMSLRVDGGVAAVVRPTFLSKNHPLGWVRGAFNAVSIYGSATGHTLFYGKGAGGDPTASAVIADIIGVASGEIPIAFDCFSNWPDRCKQQPLQHIDNMSSRFYLSLLVNDKPGMIGKIATILGEEHLNIASIHQDLPNARLTKNLVPVIITINMTREKHVVRAVKKLHAISDKCIAIPILDERAYGNE